MHDNESLDGMDCVISKIERGGADLYISPVFDRMSLVFITVKVGKYGSDVTSFINGWVSAVNLALKYKVPWVDLRESAKVTQENQTTLLHVVVCEIDRLLKAQQDKLEQCRQLTLTPSEESVTIDDS